MAGAIASRGLMLISSVFIARKLGKVGYGELGMIQSTIGMFSVFAGFGLGLTATKHVAEFRHTDPAQAGRIIKVSGIFAAVTGGGLGLGLLIFAPYLAEQSIHAPHLAGILQIAALLLLFSALNGSQTGALNGFEAFKAIAGINLFTGITSCALLIMGACFAGLTGVIWAMVVNLAVHWLLNHIMVRKEAKQHNIPPNLRIYWADLGVLWRFSLPATLSGIMVGPVHWVCRAMLSREPDGYSELGALTAALVFQGVILFVSSMVSAPLMSMISNASTSLRGRMGVINIISTWMLGAYIAVPLLCFPEIAELIFGLEYATREFRLTFCLIILCTSIMTYKQGIARVLAARSLMWWGLLSNSFWALILIVSSFFLVKWGAAGLAASITIAYILNSTVLLPLYYSKNLFPKGTLFSVPAAIIWVVIASLVLLNVMEVPLFLRGLALAPSLLTISLSFRRLCTKPDTCTVTGTHVL